MLYREIIVVCSQIHTKHINTLCGQNVELLYVKMAIYLIRAGKKNTSLLVKLCLFHYTVTICTPVTDIM
jgi:hypothetical protein